MKNKNIDVTLQVLNEWVEEWRKKHDNPPEPFLSFSSNESGTLLLNDIALCPADQVDTKGHFVTDEELLQFELRDNGIISIEIDWPYAGPPKLTYIEHSKVLFVAEKQ